MMQMKENVSKILPKFNENIQKESIFLPMFKKNVKVDVSTFELGTLNRPNHV